MTLRAKTSALVGFLAGTLTTAALASHDEAWELVQQARTEVRAMDQLAFSIRDPEVRVALHARAVRADGQLAALERLAAARPSRVVVDDRELGGMIGALQGEPFGDDRLALLGDLSRGRRFTTAQVVRLMQSFTFDSEKVEVAARLYPQVVDPQEFWTVYGALTFSSSKDDLRKRIGGGRSW